jgi:hypothetical protein
MTHTEAAYITAGHRYERASTPGQVAAASQIIRTLLEAEKPHDQTEGRRLIEQGRQEVRAST